MFPHIRRNAIAMCLGIVLLTAPSMTRADDVLDAHRWLQESEGDHVRQRAEHWNRLVQARVWTDNSGRHSIKARFIRHGRDRATVTLEKDDGQQVTVPNSTFSESDRIVIERLLALEPKIRADLERSPLYQAELRRRKQGGPAADRQEEPAATPRERRLAELRDKWMAPLAEKRNEITQKQRKLAGVVERLKRIRNVRTRTPRSQDAEEALEREQTDLKQDIEDLQADLGPMLKRQEMERRKIIVTFPEAGDPKYVEHNSRYYTQPEFEKLQAMEAEHGSARAAADTYIRELISQGRLNSARFIGTSFNGMKIHYQVQYTSGAGLVVAREGAVMTVPDSDGWWYVHPMVALSGELIW